MSHLKENQKNGQNNVR